MTYASQIQETEQSTFAELYTFQVGQTINRYTTHREDITFHGDLYLARPIKRGDFTFTEKLKSVRVRINAPIDRTLAQYVSNTPVENVAVIITRVFLDTEESFQIFQGEIIDVTLSKNAATAVCENETDIFRNKFPKRIFQARCNHMVFDDGCGLLEVDWRVTAVITVSGSDLVSATFAGFADGYFTGGHAKSNSDIRMITNHVTNTITLQVPFPASILQTNDSVFAWPGCDRSATTCKTKFDNFLGPLDPGGGGFLGFPYIPNSNPVIWGFSK